MRTAIALAITILLSVFLFTRPALPQEGYGDFDVPTELPAPPQVGDYGFGHEHWHHWYQNAEENEKGIVGPLLKPGTQKSCCNGDCRPVKAKLENGQWFAFIDREWEPVPADKIKSEIRAPGGGAHACAAPRYPNFPPYIHCFVPPSGST